MRKKTRGRPAKNNNKIVDHAFSVRQPWAHDIFHSGKNVENRSRRTNYRGTVAVHVSGTMTQSFVRKHGLEPEELPTSQIIGLVDIVDCIRNSKSRWAEKGYWHWILRNPRLLPRPRRAAGWLGLYPLKKKIRLPK